MATTTARNKTDVDSMSTEDRLWDSLNYSYGKKRESSDEAYDKAYSQADRQALSRGMQRSSYVGQTLANLSNAKVKAQNDIWDSQIADYENRLQAIRDAQDARAYQTAEREAQQAYNTAEREAQQAYNSKESALSREWQTAENAANRAEQARQYDTSLAYQRERDAVGDTQWDKQFGFNEKTTDQQIAMQYALNALQNGNMPTDDLLARAGLSREDAQAMMAKTSSGGGYNPPPKDDTETPSPSPAPTDQSFLWSLGGGTQINPYLLAGVVTGTSAAKTNRNR